MNEYVTWGDLFWLFVLIGFIRIIIAVSVGFYDGHKSRKTILDAAAKNITNGSLKIDYPDGRHYEYEYENGEWKRV